MSACKAMFLDALIFLLSPKVLLTRCSTMKGFPLARGSQADFLVTGTVRKKELAILFDELVKSQKSRHSCESRSPELPELTGFPLPA